MKPGFKTTEFWISIVVQIVSILTLAGVFTPEQADTWQKIAVQLGGLIAQVIALLGYSAARSSVKRAEEKKDCPEPPSYPPVVPLDKPEPYHPPTAAESKPTRFISEAIDKARKPDNIEITGENE